ncbi:hypothetical protein C8J56DRAFT_919713 [Mycena floridula]|nr:hypothetical protein C8J56DRAFT_919713 [Mycena floridula]
MPSPQEEQTSKSLLPTTKLAVLSRFNSLRSKPQSVAFPPPSWLDNESTDDWTKKIEEMKQTVGEPDDADSEVPIQESPKETSNTIANRIWNLLQGSDTTAAATSAIQKIDQKFAALLASESVMGGGKEGKKSVWSVLDRLGPVKKQSTDEKLKEKDEEVLDANEGIMVYAPLQPDSSSEVELADSELVLEYMNDPVDSPSDNPDHSSTGTAPPTVTPTKIQHREWRPSPTKISLQVAWWGYRLYLPPPVLAVLSDAHLEAAKRGAMISASLTWTLNKVPMLLIPPMFRPAAMMLKRLAPFLGYVGAFVAWSWERIKKKDKGDGVVLTATWLLPLALLPASWDPKIHGQVREKPAETVATEDKPELGRQKSKGKPAK